MPTRLTRFRGPPDLKTPIGHIYKHIRDTATADGSFSIEPLIHTRVFDKQSKLYGRFTVKQIHNKLDVFRKKHGMTIQKLPERYMFRYVAPSEPQIPVVVDLRAVLPLFEGVAITEATVLDLLARAKLELVRK